MPVQCAPANNKMRDALTRCALATLDTVPGFQTPFPEIPRRVAASALVKDCPDRQAGVGDATSVEVGRVVTAPPRKLEVPNGLGRGRIAAEVGR